jgi:hypothetical protein
MYVLFMLLVNGVAIAMVVIGAINSGKWHRRRRQAAARFLMLAGRKSGNER